MTKPIISLVVAMSTNRTIGVDNSLPWRLPEDLRYFKEVTMGHPIIMGRKTYDSIGRALPGRDNIVVTRQSGWVADNVLVSLSVEDALETARACAIKVDAPEIHVIGGAEIYTQSLKFSDRLYITQVHAEIEGDASFPKWDASSWIEQSRRDFDADERNPYRYSFVVFDRKK